jgi:hypothetical protein
LRSRRAASPALVTTRLPRGKIHSKLFAVGALALFAGFTALSMAVLSTGWGAALGSAPVQRSLNRVAPVIGGASLVFGVWYALGAQGLVTYVL